MRSSSASGLPRWRRVLAVVAHPDDESFGLGALIDAFVTAGADVDVLCFTHGEASTLGAAPDLAQIRDLELGAAAAALGARSAQIHDFPDGGLDQVSTELLASEVRSAAARFDSDGLLVFDDTGITGHPDHMAATAAAVDAAERLGLPVLAWTIHHDVAQQLLAETGAGFRGRPDAELDLVVRVGRDPQLQAIGCHASQAVPGSVLWRRLELQGDTEALRWLRRPTNRTDEGVPPNVEKPRSR